MSKRKTKVLQARTSDASRDDDSLLMRSAESLGRVIGSLQRQVQDGTKRMSEIGNVFGGRHMPTRKKGSPAQTRAGGTPKAQGARKTRAAKTAGGAGKSRSSKKTTRRSR